MGGLNKEMKRGFNFNPVKRARRLESNIRHSPKIIKKDLKGIGNYFDPKVQTPETPAEIPDEEAIARRRNRDGIRRRQAGGRSSTIMSDALG